jgi:hypothetical protein
MATLQGQSLCGIRSLHKYCSMKENVELDLTGLNLELKGLDQDN